METEIVFTGLCSILNPDGKNRKMGDPAVILVQTDDHAHPSHHAAHIAFIAFDSDKVEVTDGKGTPVTDAVAVPNAVPVPDGRSYVYIPIDDVEIVIENNPHEPVTKVENTYRDRVAHRDEYWPEKTGSFDPDFVPLEGDRPNKMKKAVKAWMRFGAGTLSASRISLVAWRFVTDTGKVKEEFFAEEVIYSGFPHSREALVIKLMDLATGKTEARELRFSLKPASKTEALTLIVGNLMEDDMARAVRRMPTADVRDPDADHFKFLNRVAGGGDGPKVKVITLAKFLGGAGSGSACGPGSGNGKP